MHAESKREAIRTPSCLSRQDRAYADFSDFMDRTGFKNRFQEGPLLKTPSRLSEPVIVDTARRAPTIRALRIFV